MFKDAKVLVTGGAGFKARIDLEEGIRKSIELYRKRYGTI
jgi:hypothetical protein